MKTRKLSLTLAALVISSAATTASAQSILVDMKGPGAGNPFWAAVERGALEKGKELGIDTVVLAPPTESDVAAQITQIEDQLARGIKGLALAPTDPNALAPVVEEAIADGVPVVFIDTQGSNEGVTYIGTDNVAGAALAAKFICEQLPSGSEVAILTGIVTQSTGKARADGARSGLSGCGLKIVAEQSGEWDRAKALSVMENVITGNPGIKAVFASNDNMALGAVEALKSANMLDKVMVVGFDANPDAAASILTGEMAASVAQNPANMGALGIESLVKLAKGEKLPPVIDTGTVLVTKDNAADYK